MKNALFVLLVTTAATAATPLPMIENDYDRARAEAQSRRLPLFVEVWAPW